MRHANAEPLASPQELRSVGATARLLRPSRGELLSGLVRLGFTDARTFRAGAGMWESLVQPLFGGADDTNAQRLGHAVATHDRLRGR